MYKVLLVDDCENDLVGIQSYIPWKELNCEIIATAADGLEGYDAAIKYKPDIVITDISMPIKDGFEMTKLINARLKNVFYIYMSCYQSFDYAQLAIENHAFAYILKPIRRNEMVDAVKKAIVAIENQDDNAELVQQLKNRLVENKQILQENYLTNLLLGRTNIQEKYDFLDIDYEKKYHIGIGVIEGPKNETDIIYIQRMFLNDLLSKTFKDAYYINFENDKLIMLIEEDEFMNSLQSIQDEFKEAFGNTVSFYCNSKKQSIENIHEECRVMINVLDNNFFEKNEQIVIMDEDFCEMKYEDLTLDISAIYDDLTNVFKKPENMQGFMEKYFPAEVVVNKVYLKSLLYGLVAAMCIFLASQNSSLSDIFEDETIIWRKLADFDTIVNIKQWILNMINTVKEFLNNQYVSEQSRLVADDIGAYIDSNFSSETALEESAKKQNISLYHANVIFKQYYNMTIFEYLIQKRMEEAKKLLTNTNKKIYEIAECVGYASNTYFSTAFKKYVGVNPQQYRDSGKRITAEKK